MNAGHISDCMFADCASEWYLLTVIQQPALNLA